MTTTIQRIIRATIARLLRATKGNDEPRPSWSYPSAELLACARDGRREIEAALRARRVG